MKYDQYTITLYQYKLSILKDDVHKLKGPQLFRGSFNLSLEHTGLRSSPFRIQIYILPDRGLVLLQQLLSRHKDKH